MLFKSVVAGVPGVSFQHVDDGDLSTYKDLTLVIDPDELGLSAPQLATALRAEGIDSRRYYHPPIHRQRAYAGIAADRPLPVTERVAARVLTLPLWSHMTDAVVTTMAESVIGLHEHAAAVRHQVPSETTTVALDHGAGLGGRP
jgi:dTDP-4-amino-4,6-dideoxygalactose transaminase